MPPRAANDIDAAAAAKLRKLGERRRASHEALRLGVLEALEQGTSVRMVAELANISTATVQTWKAAARKGTAGDQLR